ncbi:MULTISPECIES: VENN motif pre-toxin domain-containing protein [Pseudomonas]|uniref:VENN motif pre-toxin domain-containing protein n=1 Tax=Pseudomonas TaxID=286 RepID=UPI0022772BFE|nr:MULTISPECIES: VENN motif pre-toxin domain-containing protein [Pseudomonas]
MTESDRQIVSMLPTLAAGLAAGLAGGLASGDAAGGIAGAQAGQNAVENNNLSQTESIEFDQKKAEYAKGCAGAAAASPGCQTLKKELAALEDKGRSIFQQEYLAVGSDMGTDTVTKNEPGSVVPCVGSSNGYCVISNTKVQTREGMEWALSPASDVQAQAQLAQNQQDSIQLDQRVREKGQEWFEGGCGGVGPGSTLCQAYFAAGGQNPFTGQVASTSERIGNAAALALGLLPFLPLGLGGASTIVRNPNLTSALTDAEAGILVERGSLGAGTSVDGAGGIAVAPKAIPYEPTGSVILQGGAPVCGPACAAMTITDKTGAAISLENAIGSFVNGVRPTGVNTLELSDVISKAGVKNTVSTTMLPEQLNKALQEGASVIVQVPAGQGKHFIIVDSVKSVDGVSYYMTRDPYVGPRGVQQGLLDGAMSTGVNAIVIGK